MRALQKLISFSLILCLTTTCEPSGTFFSETLCITNVAVVDPENGIDENQTVLIKGEKIIMVVASKDLKLSPENQIIDGTGKYLIPGLWDAHVHFAFKQELAPSMFNLFLGYGITSVRDTGGKTDFVKYWKDKSLANKTTAPRVMMAGPLLDGVPNVYDGSSPKHPPLSVGLANLNDVATMVNELKSLDVDLLKAYEMLTPEQFIEINKLAKQNGLKVTGHVPLSMDVISASNAGLNSMEHLRNLELSCASNADELLAQRRQLLKSEKDSAGGVLRSNIHNLQREVAINNYDDKKATEVLQVLAKNDTWQIPTLALNVGVTNKHYLKKAWKKSITFLPKEIEQEWNTFAEAIQKEEITGFRTKYSEWIINMVTKIHRSNIEIMAGTDSPIFLLTPGQSLHEELILLVKAGLTPLQALKTATINPAKYFNMQDELGLVKEGMWADLVLLDANPVENIENTQRINSVIKNGNFFNRNQLNQLLQDTRKPQKGN